MTSLIGQETLRQILPARPAAQHPDDALQHLSAIAPRSATPVGAPRRLGHQLPCRRPLLLREFHRIATSTTPSSSALKIPDYPAQLHL